MKRATAEGAVLPGSAITWIISVTNVGGATFETLQLRDELPELTSYVPGTTAVDGEDVPDDGGMPLETGVEIGPLAPGETVEVSFDTVVEAGAPDGALILNVAIVDSTTLTTAVTSNEVEVVVGQEIPLTGPSMDVPTMALAGGFSVVLGILLLLVAWRRREEDEELGPA